MCGLTLLTSLSINLIEEIKLLLCYRMSPGPVFAGLQLNHSFKRALRISPDHTGSLCEPHMQRQNLAPWSPTTVLADKYLSFTCTVFFLIFWSSSHENEFCTTLTNKTSLAANGRGVAWFRWWGSLNLKDYILLVGLHRIAGELLRAQGMHSGVRPF